MELVDCVEVADRDGAVTVEVPRNVFVIVAPVFPVARPVVVEPAR